MKDEVKAIEETAKAAQEIARTTSDIVGASEKFGSFIAKHINSSLESAMGIFEDKLKYMRWERQQRLISRATEFLAKENLNGPTKALPLKLAVPLLEGASLEEDDELQDIWAKVLINATTEDSGISITRNFIDVLERFTPTSARLFFNIYSTQITDSEFEEIDYPDKGSVLPEERSEAICMSPIEEVQLGYAELDRLGCLNIKREMRNGKLVCKVRATHFGKAIYEACTLPSEK